MLTPTSELGLEREGSSSQNPNILEVRGLTVTYSASGRKEGRVLAVDDVSFVVRQHETLALVGETGSGKTSVGLAILNLIEAKGSVRFFGREVLGLSGARMRSLRSRLQVIFQNPSSSLDPRMRVRRILLEPLLAQGRIRRNDVRPLVSEALAGVSLPPEVMERFPHQLSGGQQQRVAVARALICNPDLVVCDEITSALDVSVQARILDLFMELRERLGLALLFISHDLGVVRHVSQRVVVLYRGRIVEVGGTEDVTQRPLHPYTKALVDSVPDPYTQRGVARPTTYAGLEESGTVSSDEEEGCSYRTRCPLAMNECARSRPELLQVGADRWVACHRWSDLGSDGEIHG